MFESNHARYASYGTVAVLPGEMIDVVWKIIDQDLQGLFPLDNLLTFKLHNHQGHTTFEYVQTDEQAQQTFGAAFDTDYAYSSNLPETVLAYDDGDSQIILLPSETNQN
ncbi:DUF960 domain-containing protein [Levilactobacillus zymae]|uniref:GTP cyclohydrolase n=1 Tax=Levilactobacillus zymae TaxID=267363 RepID=A0A1Y6K060_9LACO|nr:DUF960 domain-containing protein [Levilactobacillus zymae]MDT6980283.1 DUF960 domain-containing protein [Levilactobacillus zymae]QFR61059.1 GTP cyclohydrolase [Levilactobacillus zymae]GEO73275.1 GTP cyclohydrolase [Levilactobacillus zymae]SMS13934.1 hypothetical protein LZ3411_0884 [Levilactobacillus zymae]